MSYVHNFASFNYGDPLCGDHYAGLIFSKFSNYLNWE